MVRCVFWHAENDYHRRRRARWSLPGNRAAKEGGSGDVARSGKLSAASGLWRIYQRRVSRNARFAWNRSRLRGCRTPSLNRLVLSRPKNFLRPAPERSGYLTIHAGSKARQTIHPAWRKFMRTLAPKTSIGDRSPLVWREDSSKRPLDRSEVSSARLSARSRS